MQAVSMGLVCGAGAGFHPTFGRQKLVRGIDNAHPLAHLQDEGSRLRSLPDGTNFDLDRW
jgi:hypothetical protein